MDRQLVSGNRVKVTVAGQIFEIPQEKAQQLVSMLQSWNSVAIPENQHNNPYLQYRGSSLICG